MVQGVSAGFRVWGLGFGVQRPNFQQHLLASYGSDYPFETAKRLLAPSVSRSRQTTAKTERLTEHLMPWEVW